ncbi:hypothetical protein E4U55_005849 [Claviceps digitariae]|nr:hypothetical protein E4U55_005849 [Claviceps digitariae]
MKYLLPLLSMAMAAQALYFYIDGTSQKCFFEDLPKDTLVVGHYAAEEYDERVSAWQEHSGIRIYIFVDEVFDNNHRIVSQQGSSSGRFTFTAHEPGQHKICFVPTSSSGSSSWLSSDSPNGGIKMKLDVAIGESGTIESSDKLKLQSLAEREREADFRDQSESTNARVVRWILIQLIVIGVTCAWQLSHLRNFFIKQKLT